MPSPFPGMDPYLEDPAYWRDFRSRFINAWCEAIADVLPDAYESRIDERMNVVHLAPESIQPFYPDVAVTDDNSPRRKGGSSTALLPEPVQIPHQVLEEVGESYIEILHRPERSLVAVLELLSPTNKSGDGYQQYRVKRDAVLSQNVHVFELDLLLRGTRLPLERPLPGADYYAFLTRAENPKVCDVYPWRLREPLPLLPVPLRSPDPDIVVNLQTVFQIAYERGRYRRSLPYGSLPKVILSEADLTWLAATLARAKDN